MSKHVAMPRELIPRKFAGKDKGGKKSLLKALVSADGFKMRKRGK
jgi:hypothetical protein